MTRPLVRLGVALAVVALAACAGVATTMRGLVEFEDRVVRMESRAVPLGIGGADLAPGVRYAGGLVLRGSDLHGLSDIKVEQSTANRLVVWAVSDFGDLLRFAVTLDDRGRMVSADRAVARRLRGPDGMPLASNKAEADAEGLALADGRFLVSFERTNRILADRLLGQDRPMVLPSPEADFPVNRGMEGLTVAPNGGWLVLGEGGGAWRCDPAGCVALPAAPEQAADGFDVTGADLDPRGEGWFVVERRFRPPFDLRVRVRRMAFNGALSAPLIQLRPPASVDNFEGVAAVRTPVGTRLYLLSDDNANPLQRTLLLAFDVSEAD